jgi:DNA-binding MarR family transcriptional regulator
MEQAADYVPNWRHGDPEGSEVAGKAVEKQGRAAKQRQRALRAVWEHPGHTSKELAALTGMDRYALARRLPELLRTGCVRRTEARECRWWGVANEPVQLKMWDER